jgi:hypothetical protein
MPQAADGLRRLVWRRPWNGSGPTHARRLLRLPSGGLAREDDDDRGARSTWTADVEPATHRLTAYKRTAASETSASGSQSGTIANRSSLVVPRGGDPVALRSRADDEVPRREPDRPFHLGHREVALDEVAEHDALRPPCDRRGRGRRP